MADQMMVGRLMVLSIAVQEIARALAPAQASAVAEAIGARLDALAGQQSQAADEGIAAELAPLLAALLHRSLVSG